ncbi:hypothetical protein [Bacillus licheniformis]|uniref:hypothetical protein n=1 Tax=Bacillus licheniformis TaxID=1402 RepID=UPI0011BE961D|nr:hypothetical protein [Bacillus licheniformis]MED0689943.1 hypothetical protein [Bacillus licheniformis]MED0713599.1 hypothetical protein [Bacillus licheniformis]MED0789284.1 hypothetical protein [Bacillus licheniformis]WIW99366.1 hypothetical protein QQ984_03540 [Bacillus licheniformis]
MSELLPESQAVTSEFINTIYNIKHVQWKHKFGRCDAEEAMKEIEKELKEHQKRYEKLYKPYYDSLGD